VHVFCITEEEENVPDRAAEAAASAAAPGGGGGKVEEGAHAHNSRSSLALLGGMVGYFNSQWSFAKFRLPETDAHTVSCFSGEANQVMVITSTGQVSLDKKPAHVAFPCTASSLR
jgi:hypothetical protein